MRLTEILCSAIKLKDTLLKGAETDPLRAAVQKKIDNALNGDNMDYSKIYVNPALVSEVNLKELCAILSGNLINPHPDTTDYQFLVASTRGKFPELPGTFEMDLADRLYDNDWFGVISCRSKSSLVFPSHGKVEFDIKEKQTSVDRNHDNVWRDQEGLFQLNKNIGRKILRCNAERSDVMRVFNEIYN